METLHHGEKYVGLRICFDCKVESISKTQWSSVGQSARAVKHWLYKYGIRSCYICGWKPPLSLENYYYKNGMLHLHHITQRQSGGNNEPENLILLCPTHHEISDNLCRRSDGPRTREKLAEMILMYEAEKPRPLFTQDTPEDPSDISREILSRFGYSKK